jgi:hypothetical protein
VNMTNFVMFVIIYTGCRAKGSIDISAASIRWRVGSDSTRDGGGFEWSPDPKSPLHGDFI